MDIRTTPTDSAIKHAADNSGTVTPKHCLIQVIIPGDLQTLNTVSVYLPLEFFVHEIVFKSVNFMPDRPVELLQFLDNLREIVKQQKE